MNKILAGHIGKLLSRGGRIAGLEFEIKRYGGSRPLKNFHEWADGKPLIAAYWVRHEKKQVLFILLIRWGFRGDYYCVLFPEDRSRPLAEISQVDRNADLPTLIWNYRPTKRDGKNLERRAYFRKHFGDTTVGITVPVNEKSLAGLLAALFDLVKNRLAADDLLRDEPERREEFPEGEAYERMHIARERNSSLIRFVKDRARRTGSLACQVCGFDFARTYGDVGYGYIEAHHTRPLSLLKKKGVTRPDEIALVCSNCHRMLHFRRPWLKMRQLKTILKRKQAH